jgi:hypothetical protein
MYNRGDKVEQDSGTDITLRIYRAPSGQWWGRLIVGGEEIKRIGYCASPEAVEQAVRDTGLYPDHIEVY